MGASLTGQKNGPAPPEATGYEVDKLSRRHIESYLRGFLDPVAEATGPYFGKSLRYLLVDSWEAGMQNWSEDMLAEFSARRGYDAQPYLPVLTGRVVDSTEVSERFLWDFRRTIADMLADYHYALPAEYLGKRGLKVYGESAGTNSPMIQDALQNKGRAEIPMGEFWSIQPGETHRPAYVTDIREAASAAHVYGKPLVASESFTSRVPGWNDPPSALKWLGDYFMTLGVNRFVIHTSVHQPFADRRPGFTLGPFGQHYTRNNTWAEQSRGFISYLTRSSYLLQQGLFVGDLAYYYGEGAPASVYRGPNTEPLARAARRLRVRLREHRGAADAGVGQGRPHHVARRHELPRAGPARRPRPAHAARRPQAARPGGRRRRRGGTEAAAIAQPRRLSRAATRRSARWPTRSGATPTATRSSSTRTAAARCTGASRSRRSWPP